MSSVTAPVSMVQVPIYRISNNTTTSTWSRMTAQDATDSRRVITAHSITDDGAGGFVGGLGTVSYAGKTIVLKLASQDRSTVSYKSDHEDAKVFDDPDGPQPSLSTLEQGRRVRHHGRRRAAGRLGDRALQGGAGLGHHGGRAVRGR
ncbi:hypothetical protein GO497_25230 [Acidovorax citrulli]|nr:hypothetical protein [Paracidovorax citrulli]